MLEDIYDDHYSSSDLYQNSMNYNEINSQSNNSSLPLNSYSPFQSIKLNSMINDDNNNKNNQSDSNHELIKIEKDFNDIENNNRFILYLKMNNLLKNDYLLENDRDANRKKNIFQYKFNKIMDTIKCKICEKTPKIFYICKTTKELVCQNCLEKDQENNKKSKYCNICNQLIYSKEHFLELPVFNKILSYIKTIKGNNNKLFEDKIKDNMNKNIIICSEKIHEQNHKKEDNDFFKLNFKEEYSFDTYNQMKAVYFCMECQRPFCSDCILSYKLKGKENIINDNIKEDNLNIINDNINKKDNINNDKNQIQHNHSHPIFKIDLIKEFGIFDLLYEKQNTKEIISDLDSIDKKINDKIEYLNLNKKRMLSFIDYIRNLYVQKIDEIIDELKTINKEKSAQVKIILEKSQELSNFLNIFKSKNDFKKISNKNSLKEFINIFESFHKVPYDIYKKINSLIKVKGNFNIKDLSTFSFDLNLNNYVKQEIPFYKKEKLKIIHENQKENNKILEIKDEEENKINEEDKIKIKIKKKVEDENNKKIKEYYNCRILINNNKNEFIEMKPKLKKIKFSKDYSFHNNSNIFISLEKDLNDEEIYEKKYLAEFNINSLKKVDDALHNINFEIYDFKIY